VPGDKGLAKLRALFFGRRGTPSPAEAWLARREKATPQEVIREHFAAMEAHDLDWILATLAPERARLYNEPRTIDKRRQSIAKATVVATEPATEPIALPVFAHRYRSNLIVRVEYDLELVDRERLRDPTVRQGRDWSYYALVTEGRGKPWLIADWGR